MKSKLILSSLVLAMLSGNVLATEIHHGKLISHKEWSNGKIKGFVKESVIRESTKHLLQFRQMELKKPFIVTKQGFDSVWVHDYVPEMTVTPGTNEVFGSVNVQINNTTNAQQTYTLSSGLCVFSFDSNETPCFMTEDVISLDTGGFAFLDKTPSMSFDFTDPNQMYVYGLFTNVERSGIETVFATSDAAMIEFAGKK